jgi:hypothetical protein
MLNQLPEIAAPHPPHLLLRLMPLVPGYGDLTQPQTFARLVDDACRLIETNPVRWEGVTLDRAAIVRRCREPRLFAVLGAVYDTLAEAWGKPSWCCKSLANVKWADQLASFFPDSKFIYLYRDGRDVALSLTHAIEGEKHYYAIASDWDATQQLALRLRDALPAERFIAVSYERLVAEPEATLRAVCAFLDAAYTDRMLEFYRSGEAQNAARASRLWENLTRPVMQSNTRKFLTATSPDDLRIFESVAGRSLDALGYERVAVKPGEELRFTPQQIEAFVRENARLKERAWAELPPDDRRRRERQSAILREIAARDEAAARRRTPAVPNFIAAGDPPYA